jgi:hypothetical protein
MTHRVRFVLDPERHVTPLVDGPTDPPPPNAQFRSDAHLTQWVLIGPTCIDAGYEFDDDYAVAHPEALDPRHLSLLHALLVFKLFDDGEVIVPPPQVEAALRWPPIDRPRRALGGG